MPEQYLTIPHLPTKDIVRIFSRLRLNPERSYNGTPCWEWEGNHDPDGYSCVWYGQRTMRLHRFSFAWLVRPIPRGCGRDVPVVDHLCNNRGCWCPWHLTLATHRQNILRGTSLSAINAAKTYCPRGHPLSIGNLITAPSKKCRQCKTCHNEASKLRQRRINASIPRRPKNLCRKGLHLIEGDNVYQPPNRGRECAACRHAKQVEYLSDPINKEKARLRAASYYHEKKAR